MKTFKVGQFDRSLVHHNLRHFCPIEAVRKIEQVSLQKLASQGKKLILLDVDNTLTHWKSEVIDDSVYKWIAEAKNLGFHFAILSNTRHPERLMRLSKLVDIPVMQGQMKPSRKMYIAALSRFEVKPEEAVMIGDQILTDILGANRSGIDAIWLCPLSDKEFVGTKFNRFVEGRLLLTLYNALTIPVDGKDHPYTRDLDPVKEPSSVGKQIIKFCVVGGISYGITLIFSLFFMHSLSFHGELVSTILGKWLMNNFPTISQNITVPEKAAAPILFGLASFIAMVNSFLLNRRWTFQVKHDQKQLPQLKRFFAVSIIGVVLNSLIASIILSLLAGSGAKATTISTFGAAIIVAIWNFLGQRLYAFKK